MPSPHDWRASFACEQAGRKKSHILHTKPRKQGEFTHLVEPGLHVVLPLFVEVTIGDHVIPFGRHGEAERQTVTQLLI